MEVVDIIEEKDSVKYVIEMNQEEHDVLLRAGLRKVAEEYKPDGYKVLPPEFAKEGTKKVEMPEGMADWLIEVAVADAMTSFIDRESKKDVDGLPG